MPWDSVRFDSSGESLSRTANLPIITSFTMMGRFKIAVDTNFFAQFLVFGHATSSEIYQIGTGADGTTFNAYNGSDDFGGSALVLNRWYHAAMTVSGTGSNQFLAYLDGSLNITHNGGSGNSAGKIWIGNNSFGDLLNGSACNIMVFNRALDAGEVRLQSKSQTPLFNASLNAWYKLKNASDLWDYSGNGNHLTAAGTLHTEAAPPLAISPRREGYPAYLTGSAGGGIIAELPAAAVDFVPVAPASAKSAAIGPIAVDFLGVAAAAAKAAAMGPITIDLTPVSPTAAKSAAIGPVSVDVTPVAPTSAKTAALPAAAVDVVAASLATAKSAAQPAIAVDFLPVAPTTSKSASLTPAIVEINAPALVEAGGITAAVPPAAIDFLPVAPTAAKLAALPPGLVDFVGVSPASAKVATLAPVSIDVFGMAPMTSKTIALDPARIHFRAGPPVALALEGL